jgi:hypothetical protein
LKGEAREGVGWDPGWIGAPLTNASPSNFHLFWTQPLSTLERAEGPRLIKSRVPGLQPGSCREPDERSGETADQWAFWTCVARSEMPR